MSIDNPPWPGRTFPCAPTILRNSTTFTSEGEEANLDSGHREQRQGLVETSNGSGR